MSTPPKLVKNTALSTVPEDTDSMEPSESDVLTRETTFDDDDEDNTSEHNEEQSVTSTSSDSDKQIVIIPTNSEGIDQTQQPQRSIADRQIEDQSFASTFYMLDETETDEHHSKTLQRHAENKNGDNQPISNTSDQFSDQNQNNTETAEMTLAITPLLELSDHGYELHNIKLMKPSETIPIGFKLSKQTDPLQYIMTDIVKQSKADIAGLKVSDWLIKLEDNDVRLIDLQVILRDISRLFNSEDFINLIIARKKSSTTNNQPTSNETNILSSNGVSTQSYPTIKSTDPNIDKIRQITLKQTSGLHFNSFISDNDEKIQVHFISNIQPISAVYRAGLRNNDRILTVNNIDVTKTISGDLRLLLSKTTPVELTVIKDSKYLETIENYKRNQTRPNLSSTTDQSTKQKQSKDFDNIIFIDDQGPVHLKHCIIKKDSSHDAIGFLLYYEDDVHIIHDVEINLPGYNSGLRDYDIILFINRKSVQQMTLDDVQILLRTLLISNQIIDLIIIQKNDLQRYKDYQIKHLINWNMIFPKIYEDYSNKIQNHEGHSDVNSLANTSKESSLLAGARICVLETMPGRSIGFTIEGAYPPPFTVCKIEKNSPAEKCGLQLNDALLSVNGKSVIETSYEDTIQIVKGAVKQKLIQFVVNQSTIKKKSQPKRGSESSLSYSSDNDGEGSDDNTVVKEPPRRGTNAVQQYQMQRSKELSYTLRLCHLNTTNTDGTPASSFGFEITGDSGYGYPVISRVQPKSPGERAGLQVDDILLKVNDRKTKGADFDKVKKAIDKAKRDGRLVMLVVDKDAFNYCIQTNKKFKEPFIKVKHIFPKSKSSVGYQSLPSMVARTSSTSQKSIEGSISNTSSFNIQRLSTQSENEEDDLNLPTFETKVDFDLPSPNSPLGTARPSFPHDISSKFTDPARRLSQQRSISSPIQARPNTTQRMPSQTSTDPDESIIDCVLHAINNFFQNTGSEKSTNPDYDAPSERINNSKTHTPLLPTVRLDQNLSKEIRHISQSSNTIHSNASYDYIKEPRRCTLKIDRNKGLGFVLSATGDYDHTITSVVKNSIADAASLQINDELIEINGVNVRNIKYEEVVDMLISAMRTNDTIEMYVINNHACSSTLDTNKRINSHSLLNGNNNNNNNSISATHRNHVLSDDFLEKNIKISPFNWLNQQKMNTSYPDLFDQSKYLKKIYDRRLSGSVPIVSTGITASPRDFRSKQISLTSSEENPSTPILDISKKDAPVARLCRIRKFPSSPFYGFFLCGDPSKLGSVFISNVTKNSSAAVCGLRDGDNIIEVNGINIQTFTYETILDKIKLHMEHHDLELLVLDKKSLSWYRKRNYPITSRTLPAIVHIAPIINDIKSEIRSL